MNIDGMTPEEKRIKIAEACGWEAAAGNYFGIEMLGFPPGAESIDDWEIFPDYLHSLDAMHEAEKTLTGDRITDYINQLYFVTFQPGRDRDYGVVFATAEQRADAFLLSLP